METKTTTTKTTTKAASFIMDETTAAKGLQAAQAEKEALKAASKAKEAKAASKEAGKALKQAQKEAGKALAAAALEDASKETKEAAKKASKALQEAEKKAEKAEAKKAEAEALEASRKEAASKAKEKASEALKALKEGEKTLTIKAEAVRKGLNAAARALLESASGASASELEALVCFCLESVPFKASEIQAAAASLKASDIISAFKKHASFAIDLGEGRKQVAKAVKDASGANVYTFEAVSNYSIQTIFRSPASNKRQGKRQALVNAAAYYEKAEGGRFEVITSAEAQARIKAALEEAARQAEAKAKAEAQAEKDRLAGKALREGKKQPKAKAEGKAQAKAEEAPLVSFSLEEMKAAAEGMQAVNEMIKAGSSEAVKAALVD